jgi:hypothetical protein
MKGATKHEANAASAEPSPPTLSVVNKVLRWAYYFLFWYMPYRQYPRRGRRFVRRLYVVVFGAATVTYVVHHDVLGATGMFIAMVLSAASLKLVDQDLEGGARVPRTRWNLPADLEV